MSTRRAQHLYRLSQATENPVLSRFYRHQVRAFRKNTSVGYDPQNAAELRYPGDGHCPLCCTEWTVDNHRIRLQPRMRLTKTLRRLLLHAEAKVQSLGILQRKLVDMYSHSSNALLISCQTCGETLKMRGQSRSDHIQQLILQAPITPEAPKKTKKEKKKEKQKLKRKREREERSGLSSTTLDPSASVSALSTLSSPASAAMNRPSPGCSPFNTTSNSLRVGPPRLTSTPNTSTLLPSKPISTLLSPLGKPVASPQGPRKSVGTLGGTLGSSPLVQQAGTSKKQKKRQKALHQQLQQALKGGKPNQSSGSLTDFLSSLKQPSLK